MFKADFGDGRLGTCEIADGLCNNFNSYARVTAINKNVVTLDLENAILGEFAKFTAGEKVLIHVSATNGTDANLLGKYEIATIELVSENVLTLDKNFEVDLNYFYVQLIVINQFKNLTLKNATIAPAPYDVFKFRGGILVFQVFDDFIMENSFIDLTDAGIPVAKKNTYKPLTEQEYYETDGSKLAGQENFITADRFILNAGDGAVFIQAYNFIADEKSRIGNPKTHGRANCRGAADSLYKPSNVTNIGGSTILIAANNFRNFKATADSLQNSVTCSPLPVTLIAKYRSSEKAAGKGLARCYIASNTILPKDEKLYAFDILADDSRVQKLGIEDFGRGNFGSVENPSYRLNNIAQVSAIVGDKLFYDEKTLNGLTTFTPETMVLTQNILGEFKIGRIISAGADYVEVDNAVEGAARIISVPEFENMTLGDYKCAGALAVAVSDTLELTGEIVIEDAPVLNCGNSQSFDKFGGIFILARKIIFGENARLAAGAMIVTAEAENFYEGIFTAEPNFVYSN